MYSIHFQSNMKSIILVLALCVCTSFAYDLEEYTWEGFKKIHKRTYVGVEEMMREKIFEDNLQRITDFNAEDHSYTLGVNQFSDLTNLEFRQMMLGYDNEARLKLKTNDQQHVCSMHVDDLPTSVDWRTKGVVTPVKNQKQCGSCWSFSATGSVEGQYAMKHGNLTSFSEQQLMDCSTSEGNHGCQGGLMDFAFRYLERTADEMESDYPYQAKNERCRAVSSKEIVKLSSYRDIQRDSVTDLMEAVATIGPISVAMDASKLSHYRGGVYDPSSCSATKLDHGVLAVGYGTEGGVGYWLIKNSWGESWGENGYFRIVQQGNKCGIASQASYPVVM